MIRTFAVLAAFSAFAILGGCASPDETTPPPVAGQGVQRFAGGELYTGDFAQGRRDGEGTYTWPDGRRYVGTFRNGLPNGQGTYTLPNGEKYVGAFVDNRRTGQGVYTWPDGRKYVGEFRNDKPDGDGTYTWLDGKKYVGQFRDGQASGQGTYTWPDGRRYTGELRDNLPNGRGTLTLADGRQQSGEFRNGDYVGATGLQPAIVPASAGGRQEIPLTRRAGTFMVSGLLNGSLPIEFYLDTGAADVSIPAHAFEALKRAGSIRPEDVTGSETYMMANGRPSKSTLVLLRSLQVGPVTVQNVRASVSDYGGPALLGMSFLGRFAAWSVDNERGVLVLR